MKSEDWKDEDWKGGGRALETDHLQIRGDMLEVPNIERVNFDAFGFPGRLGMDGIKE